MQEVQEQEIQKQTQRQDHGPVFVSNNHGVLLNDSNLSREQVMNEEKENESKPSDLTGQFFKLTEKVLKDLGIILYDLEYNPHSGLLRIFIMDETSGSALIEDCVKVDHALTPFLESLPWVPEKLTLEVSSPGIYRSLKYLWHYKRVEGQPISLVLKESLDKFYPDIHKSLKGNKKIEVTVVSSDELVLTALYKEQELKIPMNNIKRANLEAI